MKIKPKLKHFKWLAIAMFSFISSGQIYWVFNMYRAHCEELVTLINKSLTDAVLVEVSERYEEFGGLIAFTPLSNDSNRYIQKTLRTNDTTLEVKIDRLDPHYLLRVSQLVLKDINPLDVVRLDSLFRLELSKGKFEIEDTYVDLYDLRNHKLICTSKEKHDFNAYIASDLYTIDIINSMGVIAYVRSPVSSILKVMAVQLCMSVMLIITGLGILGFLMKTIYDQGKEEKMRQDSINSMTHEFKRPISSAVAQIELIPYYLDEGEFDKVKSYAKNSMRELNRLTAYTERIQQISNNQIGRLSIKKSKIEIEPYFLRFVNKYGSKTVHVSLKINTNLQYMWVDTLHFSNVMDNLIENAIKYSDPEVHIELEVKSNSRYLKISVKDDGFGMSKTDKRFIFEKFYRGKNKDSYSKTGFGLGLTYVKTIVDAHKGKIDVESELGKGSNFIIQIPIDYDAE